MLKPRELNKLAALLTAADPAQVDAVRSQVPVRITGRVEIARSFSYKLNCGNYESRDFFCSQKAECDAADADRISEALYQFCKRQVLRDLDEYRQTMRSAA